MADFDDITDPGELLGVLAGAVSVCWDPRPTGIFDSAAASEFVEMAIARLQVLISNEAIRSDEREKIAKDIEAAMNPMPVYGGVHRNGGLQAAARIARDGGLPVVEIPKGSLNLPTPPGYGDNDG